MPKISVIVPVYNSEQYLHRCIDSILNQTFTDYELLLIDDGSTDNSGIICDEYASNDYRVRVFHKENGGVSSARNLGLDNAKGDWISFVDSDDWVGRRYLEVLYQNGEYDFVTCYWQLVNDSSYTFIVPDDGEYRGNIEIINFLNSNIRNISYPVCRLFRKAIIMEGKLRFDAKTHYSEDALFNITYLQYVTSIKQVGDVEYYYEKHLGSLSRKYISWADMNYTITMLGDQISKLEEIYCWNGERLYEYHIWGGLLRKYLTHLQFHQSFAYCMSALREIIINKYVCQCFSQSSSISKSPSRRLLDFLMRERLFGCAVLILKLECILLKIGLVSRT